MLQLPTREDCYLCGQIAGRAERDLVAEMLPLAPYRRRVILENEAFAVVPSLGPLRPGHVLLCSKGHAASFAALGASGVEESYQEISGKLERLLRHRYEGEVHVFEHGMADGVSVVPCTVDHAHQHFLPVPAGLTVEPEAPGGWHRTQDSLGGLKRRVKSREYLFHRAPGGDARLLVGEAGSFQSQAMRRLFAARLGRPLCWDWRRHPAPEAADATWRELTAGS